MIPVARKLQSMNHNVFIGSGDQHLSLFRNEVEGLSFIKFSGFKPEYSRFLPQYLSLFFKTPILIYHIIREHFELKRIVRKNSIDIVISDNRFGLWNRSVKSAYVTHMPLIPFPKGLRFMEFSGVILHRAIMKKYSLCFIPDLPGEMNISGRLSHGLKLPENVRYIGLLSRFNPAPKDSHIKPEKTKYNMVILSGPEPQREMLKQKLADILKGNDSPTVILEGRPEAKPCITRSGKITIYSHLPDSEMQEMIRGSKSIITRSGYTTIMDLIRLNCSALLIPTPGQTEQEYLAEYLTEKGWFSYINQNEIREGILLPASDSMMSEEITELSAELLEKGLKELLEEPHK
jgi:UDP-N-acetylglucosamine transferase subunit ALG13